MCYQTLKPFILLFASTTKQAKSISYLPKPTFGCNFLTKSPRGMGVIVLHRSRGWKDFMYVCVYVCMCVCLCVCVYTLEVAISIRLAPNLVHRQLRSRVRSSSKMGYVGPIGTPRGHHYKNYILVTFELQVQFSILRCRQIGFIKT